MSLDPAVQAQVDDGRLVVFPLVKFDIPGHPVGYHMGKRNLDWDGFTYKPNRYLSPGTFDGMLGAHVTKRTIIFSNVPTDDPDDAIAKLETLDYLNAPVLVSFLAGDPDTDEILGLLLTQVYEIDKATFPVSAADENGMRTVTIQIDLEPPGRAVRDQTYAKRSQDEQQFDNDPTDTAFEHAASVEDIPEEWGQRSG